MDEEDDTRFCIGSLSRGGILEFRQEHEAFNLFWYFAWTNGAGVYYTGSGIRTGHGFSCSIVFFFFWNSDILAGRASLRHWSIKLDKIILFFFHAVM
jgi:hypothetical protein